MSFNNFFEIYINGMIQKHAQTCHVTLTNITNKHGYVGVHVGSVKTDLGSWFDQTSEGFYCQHVQLM